MARYPGFVGPSYTEESKIAAYDETINWYPARIESGTGKATYVLYPAPGYSTLSTMPTSPGRAIFELNGTVYGLSGTALYDHIDTTPVLRAQGLSNPDDSPGQIIGNGDAGHQLLIRAGTTLYALDLSAPVTETTFLDPPSVAPNPTGIAGVTPAPPMVDGYYGYVVTFVTSTGETTASTRAAMFINNADPSGFFKAIWVQGIPVGASVVTSRNIYRTEVQVSEAAAMSAQLKLLTTIANNSDTSYIDEQLDATLGANVPTTNTASVTVEALTVMDFTSNQIAYLNGYGLSLDSSRSEVRFSAPFDFTSWDDLDVFQRSDAADRWQAMIVHHKEVWLFGSETSSVYYNSGDADTPFQPIPSVFITTGIIAPLSACVVDGQIMWIGQGIDGAGIVYRANGYTPERLSTHAIEFALSQFTGEQLAAIEGATYQENGHVFYELTVPTIGSAPGGRLDYDATDGLWHRRGHRNGLQFVEPDTRGYAYLPNTQITLGRTTGDVYHQSIAYATGTDGLGMTRLRRAPHIAKENKGTIIDNFEVHLEVGLGLATGQGSDPQIAMRFSRNGGQTWSNTRTKSAGRIGEYNTRAIWTNLGYGRDRLIEITVSDPIPWRIIDAYIDVRTGAA